MRNIVLLFFITICLIFQSTDLDAQGVTAQELARALSECQQDLVQCMTKNDSLQQALVETENLWESRKNYTDSLGVNLKAQLSFQDSITTLLKANTDTLDIIVKDYSQKLDEVSNLYIRELRRQTNPWFLQKTGLKGFFYGILFGGAAGLTYSVIK